MASMMGVSVLSRTVSVHSEKGGRDADAKERGETGCAKDSVAEDGGA